MSAGDTTQGRRLPDADDILPNISDDESYVGGYWRGRGGVWYCGAPGNHCGVGNLARHDVTEHDDGTITVSPSILVSTGHGNSWHGYLERGVWREC